MQGEDELFDRLRNGDRSALGRAITLVESTRKEDQRTAGALVERCLSVIADSVRVGITGIPGVGKSTLIDALGEWMIVQGHRVAVLAIDPSSAHGGGSILGDKTRMDRLSRNEAAFVRPTATSGNLGGVGRRTREAIVLCEAAGYDRILVETVGTGQTELDVDRMTDINLLLLIAGAGDELQGIKRGIMESADLIVFTKAEGETRVRAQAASQELRGSVSMLPPRPSGRRAELLLTNATTGDGIAALGERIETICASDRSSGYREAKRKDQAVSWMEQAITSGLLDDLHRNEQISEIAKELRTAVREGRKSPHAAATELLKLFRKGAGPLP